MPYTTEHIIRVYDDDTGSYISISPDADSLDLVDLRQVENDKVCRQNHDESRAS